MLVKSGPTKPVLHGVGLILTLFGQPAIIVENLEQPAAPLIAQGHVAAVTLGSRPAGSLPQAYANQTTRLHDLAALEVILEFVEFVS